MGVKIFTAQNADFEKAAAEVEHQVNAWLAARPGLEVVSVHSTHADSFFDLEMTHCYSLAVAYK